jgi:predicted alpha/beta hydrolase family esterase
MQIVYIHGANATGSSFNFIRQHLNQTNELVVEYDSRRGFMNNLESISAQINECNDIYFIAHSLGGIYAVHLANKFTDKVIGATTLSTPYNGAESAEYIKHILPHHRLFKDISPTSEPIVASKKMHLTHPWTNLVSTGGSSPLLIYPNDGVVTINSMRYRRDMKLIDVPVNHYEIVLKPETVNIIQGEIDGLFS